MEITTLKLRRVAIDTYKENVAYLHRDCELYRSEGFQALNKIEVNCDENGTSVIAVLNIVDDISITRPEELGLSEQVFHQFAVSEGSAVRVAHASAPKSIKAVHRKIRGERLQFEDYLAINKDIARNSYSKIEIAAYLVGCAVSGLDRDEVLYLTRAMLQTGEQLHWDEPLVVDKHCIGGIPGNRTSMLVVPIVAEHGMLMPKTSSRAITSPAGTADTMEVLANVDLNPEILHHLVTHERAFLAWGGTSKLAPVDDILIAVERPLTMDSPGQMVASIVSKKVAAGSTHLLIDIPIGPTAKIRSQTNAMKLRKLFEYVGDSMGLTLEVIITDGRQPIGHGIGPVLEARDVMRVLENHPLAPLDLREKALQLAGRILEFDTDVRGGQGYRLARDILESGRALQKMQSIIQAQGASDYTARPGKLQHQVAAQAAGRIEAIDNLQLAQIAHLAGAPLDKEAGVDLHKKIGDTVDKDEPLYTIHAEFNADFNFAKQASETDNAYQIATLS
ncbi:MAG: thymidine phosphorylase family protein [Gammaproteobacteria bacterium]|nr:thymidine phosphorylase family protein [Gammaproteobacteria bacterium]